MERSERAFLTLSQAAKAVGKSKSVISRAIAEGKLSVAQRDSNGFKIDRAELYRVFQAAVPENENLERLERSERVERLEERPLERLERPQDNAPEIEVALLRAKVESLEQRLADKEQLISDYRRIVDKLLLPAPGPVIPDTKPDPDIEAPAAIPDDAMQKIESLEKELAEIRNKSWWRRLWGK